MNPVLRLVHLLRATRYSVQVPALVKDLAKDALDEHDRLRMRVAELERENKRLKDPRDRVMTDLA